ncbi:amidohydrolase family protein [Streptomyces sp. x-80]|jgi:hypothetical protein|uniref:amidohydrolase family protein n=1 Tax=Streptomyces sp. x-80 TaxID=2789282 RepID=UPI00398058A3
MDRWGVAASFLSVSSPGTYFGDAAAARDLSRRVNEAAADAVRAHPGRFGQVAALPLPDIDGSLQELAYALDALGSDGVAIETNAGGVHLGDERFTPSTPNSTAAVPSSSSTPPHHRASKRSRSAGRGPCWSSRARPYPAAVRCP